MNKFQSNSGWTNADVKRFRMERAFSALAIVTGGRNYPDGAVPTTSEITMAKELVAKEDRSSVTTAARWWSEGHARAIELGYIQEAEAQPTRGTNPANKLKYPFLVLVAYDGPFGDKGTIISRHETYKSAQNAMKKFPDESGNWLKIKHIDDVTGRANNPAPRIGTAHPKRKSEATKKTPTKRLVARRKRNTKAGYYPNPLESQVHRTRTKKNVDHPINFPYAVQYKNTGTGEWHSLSAFKELEKAKEYAAAYANAHPYMYVRVEHATEI